MCRRSLRRVTRRGRCRPIRALYFTPRPCSLGLLVRRSSVASPREPGASSIAAGAFRVRFAGASVGCGASRSFAVGLPRDARLVSAGGTKLSDARGECRKIVLDIRTGNAQDADMPRVPKLSDQLRAAINASELSRYRIGKELGIDEATLSRFMSGERGLRMSVLDKLSVFLGVRIVIDKQAKRSKP